MEVLFFNWKEIHREAMMFLQKGFSISVFLRQLFPGE
jgi:hypothetical protein